MKTTVQTIDAMVAALEAATWTPSGGAAEPAFGRVARFDATDKESALSTLLMAESRVAVVVYAGESWDPLDTEETALLVLRRSQNVLVMVTDRSLRARTVAAFGDGARNPGALALKDVAVQALAGRLLANPNGVNVRPISARVELVADQRDNPNYPDRVFCTIECLATGGRITANQEDPVA